MSTTAVCVSWKSCIMTGSFNPTVSVRVSAPAASAKWTRTSGVPSPYAKKTSSPVTGSTFGWAVIAPGSAPSNVCSPIVDRSPGASEYGAPTSLSASSRPPWPRIDVLAW